MRHRLAANAHQNRGREHPVPVGTAEAGTGPSCGVGGDCDVAQVLQRGVAAPCELLWLRETRRVVAAAVASAVCPFSLTCRSLGLWG